MAKGKNKTRTAEPKVEETCTSKVEKETKENKHEMDTPCQGQTTVTVPLSQSKPRRETPLVPIQEENSTSCSVPSETNKQGEVKPNDGIPELGPTQQDNAALQNSSPGPKQKTDQPLNINAASNAATPNKPDRALQIRGKGRGNKSVQKKVENKDSQTNRKLTDYYPIRRSSRKSKEELKNEEQQHINDLITNGIEEGLKVKDIEGKGRGVFADRPFRKGEFVVEYHGDLIQIADAKRREASYAQDPKTGCYMYYFQYRNKTYCVDATAETKRLGRLLNHSKNGNCQTRLHAIAGVPHLILVASRDIEPGEELVYDYGDRSREAIAAHPWLKH